MIKVLKLYLQGRFFFYVILSTILSKAIFASQATSSAGGLNFIKNISSQLRECAAQQKELKSDTCKNQMIENIDFFAVTEYTLAPHIKAKKVPKKDLASFAITLKTLASRSLFPLLDKYEGQEVKMEFEEIKPKHIKTIIDTSALKRSALDKQEGSGPNGEIKKHSETKNKYEVVFVLKDKKSKKVSKKDKTGANVGNFSIVDVIIDEESWAEIYKTQFKDFFANYVPVKKGPSAFEKLKQSLESKAKELDTTQPETKK